MEECAFFAKKRNLQVILAFGGNQEIMDMWEGGFKGVMENAEAGKKDDGRLLKDCSRKKNRI